MEKLREKPWHQIHAMLDRSEPVDEIQSFLDGLEPAELLHAMFPLMCRETLQ